MTIRCAILDDYQHVALSLADWDECGPDFETTVFSAPFADEAEARAALRPFDIVCLMRERTPFPASLIAALPDLRLIVTSGPRNAAINIAAAAARGIPVCGTELLPHPTAELVFAHILEFARRVGWEAGQMRAGAAWQTTLGTDLAGKTLGIIGLGKLGRRVARIAAAFDMNVIAWSPNLTAETCAEAGVTYAPKQTLLREADIISLHLVLGDRSRGLIGADEFAQMKPNALIVNTARGPVIDEAALIDALRDNRIGGAALDVFDAEPLPVSHPLRQLPGAQITPHLGYVTADNYRLAYGQMAEAIAAWRGGAPIRVIAP